MVKEQPDYLSYLLRLWRERDEGKLAWRASLESAFTGKRYGFASLDNLFDFLRRLTSRQTETFIVRLPIEHPEQPLVPWRGEVEHIQSGQRWAFSEMDELLDFLRRQAEDS